MNITTLHSQLPAETRFLINACRSFCSDKEDRLWEGVSREGLDWDRTFQEAYQHGIAPILYHFVKRNDGDKIPQPVFHTLRATYYQNIQSNMRLFNVLDSVLKAFHENKLGIILFKGPLLLHDIYTNLALRPVVDIDILVKKEEMQVIDRVLNKLGYKSEPVKRWFLQEYYCLEYHHKNELTVEVHWELLHPQDFSQTTHLLSNSIIWRYARSIIISGMQALALSDEVHLLYMCLHMAKHFKKQIRLIWACDIALFLQKRGGFIEWPFFRQLAKESGQEQLVSEAIKFVENYLGADETIPDPISEFRFVRPGEGNFHDDNGLRSKRILQRISRIPGLWGKIQSLFEYFFPNHESIAKRYGVKGYRKVMLWRLYHPLSLAWHGLEEIYYGKIKSK